MWHIHYAIAFIVHFHGQTTNHVGEFDQVTTFATEQECLARIEMDKDRMPDYFRGVLNIDFDDEIFVRGNCKSGDPPA